MSFMDEGGMGGIGGAPIIGTRVATREESTTRGEIDMQISTARAFPRNITAFKRTAEELACLDEETAATMFYNLPRDGKRIEGPSVRLAEVVAYAWGNLRAEAHVVSEDDRFVTAAGTAFDVERNYAGRHEVTRRITTKAGKRYSDDMIQTTKLAACSIAFREAVFKVVPRSIFKDIYEKAKLTSIGKAQSLQERRHRLLEWCSKVGVDAERVLQSLGRKGIDDITIDDLITLNGIRTAIKDGDLSIEAAFPLPGHADPSEQSSAASERLRATAEARRAAADLDAVGLTGDVSQPPAATPASEQHPTDKALAALRALVADTRPTGKAPLADERTLVSLRQIAMAIGSADSEEAEAAADGLLSLANDPKLAASQAVRLQSAALLAAEDLRVRVGGAVDGDELALGDA